MVTNMKVIGKMTINMVLENLFTKMETNMRVNSIKIINMEKD